MKKFFEFVKQLLDVTKPGSSKSFALLVSAITGGLVCVCIMYCLIWDVVTNGYIKTNLYELGIFILCVGGYVAGSGVTKTVVDSMKKRVEKGEEKIEEGKDK